MPAPILQVEGAIGTGVTTGVPTITIPAHLADDILVVTAMIWVPNTPAAADQIPPPAGWTVLGTQVKLPTAAATADGWVACFWRRATAAGTTVTLTRGANWDTGADTCFNARAYVVRGCRTAGNPYEFTASAGGLTAANGAFPAITVSGIERTVIHFGGVSDNLAFSMASTGWTIGTEASNTGGTDSAFQTAWKEDVSASTTADTATVTAPGAGGYGFIGASFVPEPVILLDAISTLAVTIAAGLTTAIEFAASRTLAITSAAGLTTEKRLAAAPVLAVTATGEVVDSTPGFGTSAFGQYPFGFGETPTVPGAEFQAAVSLSVTTAAPLTTIIRFAAAPIVRVTTAAQITTEKRLAATSTLALTTAAQFTTIIRFAAAPSLALTSAASLTTEKRLTATSALALTSAGALTTEKRLVATSTLAITAASDLTIPIPGAEFAASATLAITTAPATLTTEKHLAAASTVTITATPPLLTTVIPLAGASTLRLTAASSLTNEIRLVSASSLSITASASLQVEAGFLAAATLAVTSAGALTTEKRLAATSALVLTTVAPLFTEKTLVTSVTLAITSAVDLTTEQRLVGTSLLALTASGALTTELALAAASTLAITSTGDLSVFTTLEPTQTTISLTAEGTLISAAPQIAEVGSIASAANNPLSGNFALPGAWQPDDLAIFWWTSRAQTKTFVDQSGGLVTTLYNTADANGVLFIGSRVLQAGDLAANMDWTSPTITNASVAYGTLILHNIGLPGPIEADSGTPTLFTNVQSPNPPPVVVATAASCVVTIFGKNNDYATITAPAGYTLAGAAQDTLGTDGSGGCAYRLNVPVGTEDPPAWTLGGAATDDGHTWTCAVKPLAPVGAELEGAVTLILTSAGSLTTETRLAATLALAVTAAAELGIEARFATSATLAVTTAASLTTEKRLAAAPTLAVTTSGALTTETRLATSSVLTLTASAGLTTETRLVAASTLALTSSAALVIPPRFAAAPTLALTSSASLSTAVTLATSPTLRLTTQAFLFTVGPEIGGSANLILSTAASLTTAKPIAASATLALTASGAITQDIRLAASASLAVTAQGHVTTVIPLAAQTTLTLTAVGELTQAIVPTAPAATATAGPTVILGSLVLTVPPAAAATATAGPAIGAIEFQALVTLAVTASGWLSSAPLVILPGSAPAATATGDPTIILSSLVVPMPTASAATATDDPQIQIAVATLKGSGSLVITATAELATAITLTAAAPKLVIGASGELTIGFLDVTCLHNRWVVPVRSTRWIAPSRSIRWVVPSREVRIVSPQRTVRWITIRRTIRWMACPIHVNGNGGFGHMEIEIVQGSTEPIECYLEEKNPVTGIVGPPQSVLSVVPELVLRDVGGVESPTAGDVTVLDPVLWKVSYTPDPDDFKAIQGPYTVRYRITNGSTVFSSPSGEADIFKILPP